MLLNVHGVLLKIKLGVEFILLLSRLLKKWYNVDINVIRDSCLTFIVKLKDVSNTLFEMEPQVFNI